MPATPVPDLTQLIRAWGEGDAAALDSLLQAAYPELHRIAANYFRHERSGHTLQSTALINEAFMRLVRAPHRDWKDRAHFFAFSALLMRGILVDHARARRAEKRGPSPTLRVEPDSASTPEAPVDILDLHLALEELERLDPLQSRIVELRYFGGLSIPETARMARVSESTVKREWIIAKAWLHRRLLPPPTRP